jgi:hypothetical protein
MVSGAPEIISGMMYFLAGAYTVSILSAIYNYGTPWRLYGDGATKAPFASSQTIHSYKLLAVQPRLLKYIAHDN